MCAAIAPEITLHIFCGQDFLDRVNIPGSPNVRVYCTDTDFVGAAKLAAKFARENGLPFEGGFFNPGRREGLKLAYLEAFDQLAPREPDVVLQAISSGMGIYGAHKGIVEYRAMGRLHGQPRIVCAQQLRCVVGSIRLRLGKAHPRTITRLTGCVRSRSWPCIWLVSV